MALTSVYYDGPVTETDRAKNLAGAPEYGVYGPDDFKVTAHPSIPYAVLVKAGKAHGHGVTDTAAQDQVVQCATLASGQIRWDLIVVRRNWQPAAGGPSTLEYVQAGANPEIPTTRKVGPGVEDDQPIFFVKWQGGTSAPVDFLDARVWTGNGGLYAKNDIVRTYLGKAGTQVNINGALWTCRLGANDIITWEKTGEAGKVPLYGVGATLVGGTPPAGAQFLEQEGTFVGTTDSSGFCRLTFPVAFPSGLVSIHGFNGDSDANGPGTTFESAGAAVGNVFGQSGLGSKSDWVYRMVNASGAMIPNKTHRINWRAKGW